MGNYTKKYMEDVMYQIRTDLALETQEKMQEDHVELKGVRFLEEKIDRNLIISTVVIETENGAKTMGKPKGTYITIEAGNMDEEVYFISNLDFSYLFFFSDFPAACKNHKKFNS